MVAQPRGERGVGPDQTCTVRGLSGGSGAAEEQSWGRGNNLGSSRNPEEGRALGTGRTRGGRGSQRLVALDVFQMGDVCRLRGRQWKGEACMGHALVPGGGEAGQVGGGPNEPQTQSHTEDWAQRGGSPVPQHPSPG